MKSDEFLQHGEQFVIQTITDGCPIGLWDGLEQASVPPWLLTPDMETQTLADTFPDGQLFLMGPNHEVLGGMLSKKIQWNGFANNLYSLMTIKGQAHEPDGDTLVITDLHVIPSLIHNYDVAVDHITENLLCYAQDLAKKEGVQKILLSIPPSESWFTKGINKLNFESYLTSREYQGHLNGIGYIDNNVQKYRLDGFSLIAGELNGIYKHTDLSQFEMYKKIYNPTGWSQINEHDWHCNGTNGIWSIYNTSYAMYHEPNIWMGKAVK